MSLAVVTADQDVSDCLAVSEIFHSLQGEGPSTGRQAVFVRLMACNLACTWCDEPETWNPALRDADDHGTYWSANALVDLISMYRPELVVITGGEPLLHQRRAAWDTLLDGLGKYAFDIEVETNGTVVPTMSTLGRVRFNVSPKLANSGMPLERRINPDALAVLAKVDSVFKFVVTGPADLVEVAEIVEGATVLQQRVWIMPEGTTPETVLANARSVADQVVQCGWNLTLRQHVLLWPDEAHGR